MIKSLFMDRPGNMLRKKGFFIFAMPLFFVLHGFIENYDFVPLKDAGLLLLIYIAASLVLTALAWIVFRNVIKAAIFSVALMTLHFFFGSLHDFLKYAFPGSFISKYSFLLPFLLAIFIILFIYLKKSRKPFHRLILFLNLFLGILILFDFVLLATKANSRKQAVNALPDIFTPCTGCPKPDIYFILADEYAGPRALQDVFNFNDSTFISSLDKLGFQSASASTSNYNYTPFALASILNMDYLDLDGTARGKSDLAFAYGKIKDNSVLRFLRALGYEFYNYSVFDFQGQPARTMESFLPVKTRLITAQTLLSRIDRDIRFNMVTRLKSKRNERIITYANKKNNENLFGLTKALARSGGDKPKFVYTHLMMPHYPYYYDSAGREQPYETLREGQQVNRNAYIGYLRYTNSKLLELVTHIKQNSAKPPVIILMGDHGFRHFNTPVKKEYYFQNLLSLHLPGGKRILPDTVSGVNVFRILLNEQFSQQLPLLPDSMIYLAD